MKRLTIFLTFSLLLHILLFIIPVKENNSKGKNITHVDIVQKEHSAPAVSTPTPSVPSVPAPSTPDTTQTESQKPQGTKPTGEKKPKYQTPPAPYTTSELIRELLTDTDNMGPSKTIESIVRENIPQSYPSGEDGVSFSSMSAKYEAYFKRFAKSLYNEWEYPEESIRKKEKGIARVKFSIQKDGKITNISILESSGYPALDREILRTLKTMKHVPFSNSLELEVLHITGYFIYTFGGDYRLY